MTNKPFKLSFKQTMSKIQSDMTTTERLFSRVIHLRAVDAFSQILSRVIFRPVSLIVGTASAIIIGSGLYTLSMTMGYAWVGSEIITLFIAGWVAGMVYEYIILLIKGRQ